MEASSYGLSEYDALGLAVLGTNAGGAAEPAHPANGHLVVGEMRSLSPYPTSAS